MECLSTLHQVKAFKLLTGELLAWVDGAQGEVFGEE